MYLPGPKQQRSLRVRLIRRVSIHEVYGPTSTSNPKYIQRRLHQWMGEERLPSTHEILMFVLVMKWDIIIENPLTTQTQGAPADKA